MVISLYRKWRPQDFSDIIGQDHIRDTLKNAIKTGKISHAYLFSGPRATGKTSTARILAKAVNCSKLKETNPCNKCHGCIEITDGKALDVIEIDAASSRGIDEIRELRERVKFSPSLLKYKVFIIDEVHMLTKEAFNALLKTLEEPPPHVIFILITTEIHKIPKTIISRCQRFDFRRIKIADLVSRLFFIAKHEKINIEKEALGLIAQNAAGGMRDAIGLLEQAASYGKKITLSSLQSFLGLTDIESVFKLVKFLAEKDTPSSLRLINRLLEEGYDMMQFNKNITAYLRDILIVKIGENTSLLELTEEQAKKVEELSGKFETGELLKLISLFLQAEKDSKQVAIVQLPLEMAVVEANLEERNKEGNEGIERGIKGNKGSEKNKKEEGINQKRSSKKSTINLKQVQENWDKILDKFKEHNHSIRAFLKSSKPSKVEKENLVIIEFYYPFHKEKISESKNLLLVEKVFSEVLKSKCRIKCVLGEKPSKPKNSKSVDAALKVFGGEVVEE